MNKKMETGIKSEKWTPDILRTLPHMQSNLMRKHFNGSGAVQIAGGISTLDDIVPIFTLWYINMETEGGC